jgi:hypothetical protein
MMYSSWSTIWEGMMSWGQEWPSQTGLGLLVLVLPTSKDSRMGAWEDPFPATAELGHAVIQALL